MILVKALRSPSDKCEMSAVISVDAKIRRFAPTEDPGGVFVSLAGSVMLELQPVSVIRTISTKGQIRSLFFIQVVSQLISLSWWTPLMIFQHPDYVQSFDKDRLVFAYDLRSEFLKRI